MITQRSIDEVNEKADLVDVIGKYVTLKKKGANWVGKSPWVNENTPSFTVSPAKGLYKCFSSGNGGNTAISFMMDIENFSYPEAIKYLADKYSVQLEYDKPSEEDTPERKLKRADYLKINKAAARRYVEIMMELKANEPVPVELLEKRALTPDSIITFQIGYAPNKDNYICQLVTNKGLFNEAAELGLIRSTTKEDGSINNFDVFYNRVMFPIHNERGEVVGFGGRTMGDAKKTAKYLNSPVSLVYQKDKVLYGLYQAATAIKKMGFAVVVEGYYDVISFHQAGMANTVAPCGTALTEGHAKLLKRHTNHVILIGDGDAAGQKANLKAVDILLKENFKVDIVELPEKHDPDSFARELSAGVLLPDAEPELVAAGDDDDEAPF